MLKPRAEEKTTPYYGNNDEHLRQPHLSRNEQRELLENTDMLERLPCYALVVTFEDLSQYPLVQIFWTWSAAHRRLVELVREWWDEEHERHNSGVVPPMPDNDKDLISSYFNVMHDHESYKIELCTINQDMNR